LVYLKNNQAKLWGSVSKAENTGGAETHLHAHYRVFLHVWPK